MTVRELIEELQKLPSDANVQPYEDESSMGLSIYTSDFNFSEDGWNNKHWFIETAPIQFGS